MFCCIVQFFWKENPVFDLVLVDPVDSFVEFDPEHLNPKRVALCSTHYRFAFFKFVVKHRFKQAVGVCYEFSLNP
jgi:hypothetical protein